MGDNSLRDVVTAASYPELTGNFITRSIVIRELVESKLRGQLRHGDRDGMRAKGRDTARSAGMS